MNDMFKNILLWVVIGVVLVGVFNNFSGHSGSAKDIEYSQFVDDVNAGRVEEVTFQLSDGVYNVEGSYKSGGEKFSTQMLKFSDSLEELLTKKNVIYKAIKAEETSFFDTLLLNLLPVFVLVGLWIFFMRQMQGGGKGGALSFGKSRARLLNEDQVKTNLSDVAGCDEAKEEVAEIVDYLRDPGKFQKLGGKIPRGVLMVGPPGTGKTLLARAIAGEAKVPFFTISGSDFVEMFVGVGASRVRDMFEQAKKHAPCIVFIDEIDAVGRHRGAGLGGGHDEREQTLNQLLVEMDGFEGSEGVIIIAATNRPDVLDPALMRPGRFDRQVVIGLPDIRGREQILKVHLRKVPAADDVDPAIIARGTPGFSGADLANLVNEAALFAARANERLVKMEFFDKAKDKIMMGVERKSMVMSEEEKLNTAYHEAGHTIVGHLVGNHDPVYKVTIIPRGRALGVTMYLPEQDRLSYSKDRLESMLSSLFGGRIAEEMLNGFGGVTTGASNDIQRATEIARNMVTKWGLSEKLGPLLYAEDQGEVFLGRSITQHKNMADTTARSIDEEIRAVIDRNYKRAEQILRDNNDKLKIMAEALMKYETLDHKQIEAIMRGETPTPPDGWKDNGNGKGSGPSAPAVESADKNSVGDKPAAAGSH